MIPIVVWLVGIVPAYMVAVRKLWEDIDPGESVMVSLALAVTWPLVLLSGMVFGVGYALTYAAVPQLRSERQQRAKLARREREARNRAEVEEAERTVERFVPGWQGMLPAGPSPEEADRLYRELVELSRLARAGCVAPEWQPTRGRHPSADGGPA